MLSEAMVISPYIICGECECRIFRCKDQGRLGDLLYTTLGRISLLSDITGYGIFNYVDFEKDHLGNIWNVLLVPKFFRRPVCSKWDTAENVIYACLATK